MIEPTIMFQVLVGIIACLLVCAIFFAILVYRLIKYQSDRILANSLGEAKILESSEKSDIMTLSGFPETDEVLAKKEDNVRKAKLIKLNKEAKVLDKEMDKIVKTYG